MVKLELIKKKNIILCAFTTIIVFLIINSIIIEPNMIIINHVSIADAGTELVIAFLSDFQRRDADPAFIQKVVNMVNEENPDLILLGGDYIEASIDELPSIAPLKTLKSRLGTYGVMGNHDYGVFGFSRIAEGEKILGQHVLEYMESPDDSNDTSIKILRNEKVILDNDITLIGLDDLWAHLRDENTANAGQSIGYRILLSHNQDDLEISKDVADLYLFGHTHCGQIRLPGIGSVTKILGFSGEYDMGHYTTNDGVDVYTTCGLAPWPRLMNYPEITVIQLM